MGGKDQAASERFLNESEGTGKLLRANILTQNSPLSDSDRGEFELMFRLCGETDLARQLKSIQQHTRRDSFTVSLQTLKPITWSVCVFVVQIWYSKAEVRYTKSQLPLK